MSQKLYSRCRGCKYAAISCPKHARRNTPEEMQWFDELMEETHNKLFTREYTASRDRFDKEAHEDAVNVGIERV